MIRAVLSEEALFIDDTPRHVEAAAALGMQAVLFDETPRVIERVRSLLGRAGSRTQ